LKEYIELLLEENQLNRALEVLSTFKLSEFQAYFNNPCFDILESNLTKLSQANEAIVYTFITKNKTYLLTKLPEQKIKIREISIGQEELTSKIVEHRENLNSPYNLTLNETTKYLYNLLIEPIEQDLNKSEIEEITFIHDGILRNIPMESLRKNGTYLIEKYAIYYRSGLTNNSQVRMVRNSSLIAGASEFKLNYEPLPFVKKEIEFLSQFLRDRVILFNEDFTIANLTQQLNGNKYDTIHLATHGFFGGRANNSYLVAYNRRLYISQLNQILSSTALPPVLLVLSACETAAGSAAAPLGISGMGIRIGAENVIGSLWTVQDDLAASFMEDFYTYKREGFSIAEAKRLAQLKYIDQNPSLWSSFIIFRK